MDFEKDRRRLEKHITYGRPVGVLERKNIYIV